jgi:hypothetical protein
MIDTGGLQPTTSPEWPLAKVSILSTIIRSMSDLIDHSIEGQNPVNRMIFINHHTQAKYRNVRFRIVECKQQRRCFVQAMVNILPDQELYIDYG